MASRSPLRRLPTRWRIIGWIVVVVIVLTVAGGWIAIRVTRSRLVADMDREMRAELATTVAAVDLLDPAVLATLADARGDFVNAPRALIVLGPEGTEVAVPSGIAEAPDPLPDLSAIPFATLRAGAGEPFEVDAVDGDTGYRALAGQLADGRLAVVATPLGDLDRALENVGRVFLVVAVVAIAVLAIVATLVVTHITRPLDAMIVAAEGIGSGQLDARVPLGGVDDVDRLAHALNEMLSRLQQAFDDRAASEEALRRFVADASHELRTPVAAILGYAELHQRGVIADDEQVAHAVARIAAEGERMRLLVEEMLTLARLDQHRAADLTDVDLAALTAAAIEDAAAIAPDRVVELRVVGDDPVVPGDALVLRRAVDNLLTNTRAHTPPGTRVVAEVRADAGAVSVAVTDDGPGIAAADLPHVFERFFRAERSRSRPGGSGLGLSIVAAIAHAHGGTVDAVSQPGVATTFTVTIPRARPALG